MFNYVVLVFLLALPAVAAVSGWFASVRGGQLSPYPSGIYPRALSNIAYAYGHIKDKEEEEEGKEKLINVKSTVSAKKWSDEDYEEEDHFFHSLYHNNDDKVVANASTKKTKKDDEEVDLEDVVMFKRLNDKIFHRRRGGEEKKGKVDELEIDNIKYGLQEVFEDVSFFE